MIDRRAYLRALIGKPYLAGARGPDAYDCEGLASAVWRDLFDRALPGRSLVPAIRREWDQLPIPVDGAIVMMRADDQHIGVYLREGGVIHALERAGVLFDSLNRLPVRGLGKPRFYLPR